eukprot:COSAG02_NODE_336_length_24344_cov_63.239101_15_plen_72_part_00
MYSARAVLARAVARSTVLQLYYAFVPYRVWTECDAKALELNGWGVASSTQCHCVSVCICCGRASAEVGSSM